MAAAHPAAVAAAVDILPVAAVMGGIGLVGIAGMAGEQSESLEQGTLAAHLKERYSGAETAVRNAMQDQREIAIAAGLQVQRLIARARIAFRNDLNKKVEAVDEAGRSILSEIDSALAQLGRADTTAVKQAGDRAQAAADKLAVPAQMPQVRSFGPMYLFSFLPFQTLTVRGDFPAEYPGGESPLLTINGKSFKAHSYDTQSLAFSLPTGAFAAVESQVPLWGRADLAIPWEQPRFDSFARAGYQNFVVVGLLPHSPGRVTIEHRIDSSRSEEIRRSSNAFSLGAEPGETEQTACLTLEPKDLAAGWSVKAGSGSVQLPAQTGSGWQDLGMQTEDDRSVCWRVRLGIANADQAASADPLPGRPMLWRISAVLRRDVSESRSTSETFDLAWGGNRLFNYPAGSWKLRYAKYGGTEVEFTATDRSSPLFRVDADARSVKVSAYPF